MQYRNPVLEAKKIQKKFPGVLALNNVDFCLLPGEIHGLMGENGAGKSTLIKCLTGVYKSYKGEIIYNENKVSFSTPLDANKAGISAVYQEINLIPTLSVTENIFAGRQPNKKGIIDWDTMKKRSRELLNILDIDIDITARLSEYSTAIQQMVAIARALDVDAKVLILDEPTSSLDEDESEKLFKVMKNLKKEGMGIIFISHFIDQVINICDRMTILRNGEYIGVYKTKDISKHDLITKMLGKELASFEDKKSLKDQADTSKQEVFYKVENMSKKNSINNFSLEFKKGEVLGLGGLLGSGRTEMAKLLYGVNKPNSGSAEIYGSPGVLRNIKDAVNKEFGYCPEDRRIEGLFLDLTIRENIILALQVKNGLFKYIPLQKQKEIANKYMKALSIKAPSVEENVSKLSGGNQQKVVIARWMAANPNFLILDEPTRGIDVGAKVELQKLIFKFRNLGMSILFISSEIEEIIRCADRIAVLRDRNVIGELSGDEVTGNDLMHTIAHGEQKEGVAK